ncbi:TonB family protein [Ekhidna sp.]|uniref:energy transducer TonB n=1 Tax=Ekhidna sp. TaxID=2608089 RepID=UPI003BA93A2A
MSEDKNHISKIERYLKGQMSPEEAHAFEREALDDPFTQEALEGFESQGIDSLSDLEQLKKEISAKKKQPFSISRIAAVIALLIVGSFTVYFFTTQIENEQLALEKEPVEEIVNSTPIPDTTFIQDQKEVAEGVRSTDENDQVKEFKQDGLRVEDKDDDVTQLLIEEDEGLLAEVTSDEVFAKIETEEVVAVTELVSSNDDPTDVLKTQVSGAAYEKAEIASDIDSSQLDEVVIIAQPLLAQESTEKINSLERGKRSKTMPSSATLRSLVAAEIITGKVIDDSGEPLPGVNVVIKGTTTGVITNIEGNFQLPKTDNQTLVFSFVGFETQEIDVGNRSSLEVTLGGATALQEVVVTGYSTSDEGETGPSYSPAHPTIGNRAYKKYLEENLQYPVAAKDNEIEGTVVLEIRISSSGDIQDIFIKKSLGYGCDQEAIRLVEHGPGWNSAEKDGNPVEDKLRLKVKFKL